MDWVEKVKGDVPATPKKLASLPNTPYPLFARILIDK